MNECLVNVMHSLAAKFINQSSKTIYFDEFSEISLYRLRSIVRDSSKTGNLKHRFTHKHNNECCRWVGRFMLNALPTLFIMFQ